MSEEMLVQVITLVQGVAHEIMGLRSDVAVLKHGQQGLAQDVRMVRAAINDFAKTNVTSGEVEVIHEDLNRLQRDYSDLAGRVGVIELGRAPSA